MQQSFRMEKDKFLYLPHALIYLYTFHITIRLTGIFWHILLLTSYISKNPYIFTEYSITNEPKSTFLQKVSVHIFTYNSLALSQNGNIYCTEKHREWPNGWNLWGGVELYFFCKMHRKICTYILLYALQIKGRWESNINVLFWISILLYCMRELSAQLQERREVQGTASKQWLVAVPCPPLRSCGWAESSQKWSTYKFPIWKITDHKWKQLILVANFFLALRVNEITNKNYHGNI
jgi:hypothetical protein